MKNVHLSKDPNRRYTSSNLGLHCHCAENKEKLLELFELAKKENVDHLVINNYKSLKAYTEVLPQLSDLELEPYKEISLIPSVELPGSFTFTNLDGTTYNIEVHILGYGVDLNQEELLNEFCSRKYRSLSQIDELQRLINVGTQMGLKFDYRDAYLDSDDDNRKFAGRAFMQALMKNMEDNFCKEGEDNKSKLPYELRTNWRGFQNRCVKDINSPFYLDVASLNPPVEEVIDLIHEMGGKAYLAHPSSYFAKTGSEEDVQKAFRNTVKFAEDFMHKFSPKFNKSKKHIDGVEVYHPSYLGNIDVTSEVKELARIHKMATSGGTDIHVDKTLGEDETVSSDSLGGSITRNKIRKFKYLRRKAVPIKELRDKVKAEKANREFLDD